VVEMRRFEEATTLAATVIRGQATAEIVAAVGRRLARFHADARRCPIGADVLVGVERIADGNFETLLAGAAALAPRRVLAAQRFAIAFLAGRADMLVARAAAGHVREGHGDLRAEHVLLNGEVTVVDCAEFDAQLREVDVGADLAFLVMDLARLGRPDLGRALVDAYRDAGGDPGPDATIAYYAAVKAWVRAKVAVLRASEPGTPTRRRVTARIEARQLFTLGEQLAWRARLPLVMIVCGPPASGKSHLAQKLSEVSGLSVVGSDETRKRLSGLEPTQHAPQCAYTAAVSKRTYAQLGSRAAEQVGGSGGVVVDATFGRSRDRRAFSAAYSGRVAPLVFECRAPTETIQARARSREQDPQRTSDAGPAVAARLRERFEPMERDVEASRHFVMRTDQSVETVLEDVMTMLDRSLAQLAQPTPGPANGLRSQ